MDWLDNFNQKVQETQQESFPKAPAQLQPAIQAEPATLPLQEQRPEADWLDAFDKQVQETQEFLETPDDLADTPSKKTFDSWFGEKYSGTKEFLEASGESAVQLGYGAISFLPSYGLGFATMLNEKLKNVLRQDRIEETVRRGGFPEDLHPTDLARKPMTQRLEEAKIKTPKEIRALAEDSSAFFSNVMGEPVTKGGKRVIGKTGELLDWLFHYPHVADKKLTEAGYPNLGYLTGFAGEMLLLKGLHGAAKKGKQVSKTIVSRYIKTIEDVKDIKTPAEVKVVSRQVDKILDQLGVTEEQRMIATDKTVRTQQGVGSWLEERAKIRREVPSAKEAPREIKAPIKKEELIKEAPERLRVRDAEKDRLEAPKEEIRKSVEVAGTQEQIGKPATLIVTELDTKSSVTYDPAKHKIIRTAKDIGARTKLDKKTEELYKKTTKTELETVTAEMKEIRKRLEAKRVATEPFVRKLNIEEKFGKQVAEEISNGIKVAEDMAVFETIRAAVASNKKVGEIMKEIKRSRYYEEDLKDFGYSEKDLRSAINAVKVREFGDVKVAERLKTIRVDVERGRPPGVKADLKKYERPVDVRAEMLERKIRAEAEMAPLRTAKGKIVGSKVLAERMAKSRGLVGDVVRTPDKKGWYVKKTKEMKKAEIKATKKLWDDILKEEDLGEIEPSKTTLGRLADAVGETLWDEKGVIDPRIFELGTRSAVELLKKVHRKVRGTYIKNFGRKENTILENIMYLHTKGKIDADLTYSSGTMWKGFSKPKYKFDKFPQTKDTIQADIGIRIPVEDAKFESIMFDPHYLVKSAGAKSIGIMGRRFTRSFTTEDLWNYYNNTIKESYRVLQKGGKLVVKIQDATSRLHIANTNEMYNFAVTAGFKPIDKFYFTRTTQLPPPVSAKNIYGGYDIARARKSVVEYQIYEKPIRSYKHPRASILEAVSEAFKNEKGAVTIQPETVKKLQDSVKRKKVSEADLVAEMKRRGVPNSQILRAFPNAFKKTAVEGTSEFLKGRQEPEDFLPRRIVKRKTGRMKYARYAPAVTRGDAHVVSTFTKDLPRPIFGEKVRTLATSEGLFTQLGKQMREVFYYPMRKAAKTESDFVTTLVKESNQMKRTFSLGTRQKHAERIEKYSVAQQKDGLARLRAQGVKDIPKKLTPKEQTVYDEMQKVYKNLFVEINKSRRAAGQQLFPPVENYSPWFHDMMQVSKYEKMDILTDLGQINKAMSQLREIPSRIDRVSRAPGMAGHEKFRAGPETPGFLHLNAFDNFNAYARLAGRAIHIGPTTAYLHELLLPQFKLAENAPNAWKFVSDWLDFQKGHEPIMFIENPVTRRRMGELSSNVAVSYISYVWSSVLNQASSLNNTIALIGLPRTIEGAVKLLNPVEHKRASKSSDIITVRSPEVALMAAGRPHPMIPGKIGRTISDALRGARTGGTFPMMLVDSLIAKLSWLGSDAQAKAIFKSSKTYKEMATTKRSKALEDFRKHYADDVVERAQGSATRAARAPFQRTAEGKAATTLQTFVIANFDLLSRQVLGIKNPDITNFQRVQRITRYVAATAMISYAFDFMGMRSPVPQPVKAAKEKAEKLGYVTDTEKFTKISKAVGMELLEYVPIYGGKFKYGSEIGGVLVNELVALGQGDPTAIPRLLGLPLFHQFLKSYRAAERGGTDVDIIFGRYIKKPKTGRAKRSGR